MTVHTVDWDESAAVDERVETLLGQMTLDEKIALVSGQLGILDDGSIPAMPAGLPPLGLADGPAGVRVANPEHSGHRTTALPAPIALAATWSTELAGRYGHVIGAEGAAIGRNIFLGPAVDIARSPWGGRTFESFGEDPLLQARLVAPEIQAIQSHPVVACIKHFIVNNQEYQRSTIDVQIDERTLQEIYLPPFTAAVREGKIGSVMGSYNKINGVHACENPEVLTKILRDQLGFRGFVMSDYLANPSTAASAEAGLEWELGARSWGPKLLEAVQAGEVAPATLDEMVRRILRPIIGLGLADQPVVTSPIPILEHSAEARAIAEQAIVLLKNHQDLLPLDATALRSIAVIGPDANNASTAGGGSGKVQPAHPVSVLEAVRARVGSGVTVAYAPGVDPIGPGVLIPGAPAISSGFLAPAYQGGAGPGLLAQYWNNTDFTGEPVVTRIEPRAELNFGFVDMIPGFGPASPKALTRPSGLEPRFSVRWSGVFTPPVSGDYTLTLTALGAGRLFLDERLVLDSVTGAPVPGAPWRLPVGPPVDPQTTVLRAATTSIQLVAGRTYSIGVEYAATAPGIWIFGEAMLRLGWRTPAGVLDPAILHAAEVAQRADVAVVVVRTCETEEMDRPDLRLPGDQAQLIRAVATANPRTVVVLMNAGPVTVAEWEPVVPAILEAWYAGQEQGPAVTNVLFGDVNPSGRLPLTFPRDETQTPLTRPDEYPGVAGMLHYTDGLLVGYRGYEARQIEPQYPFGYGLTYTKFDYANIQVIPAIANGTEPITVSFDLRNSGARAGIEVAQVYLGLPVETGAPPRRLAGWVRVALEPGERRRVTVTLEPASPDRPLSFWDAASGDWRIAPGSYKVYAGASVKDIRLTSQFRI